MDDIKLARGAESEGKDHMIKVTTYNAKYEITHDTEYLLTILSPSYDKLCSDLITYSILFDGELVDEFSEAMKLVSLDEEEGVLQF